VDIIVAQTPRLNKGVFAGSDAAKVKVCCLDAYDAAAAVAHRRDCARAASV
jgi:hypothetical protein